MIILLYPGAMLIECDQSVDMPIKQSVIAENE